MGCSICLDGYFEDEGDNAKNRRPIALLCGHIFHKECSDSWLKQCKLRNDPAICPVCKREQGTSKALQLWPGDVRDIDAYMANRNRRIARQQNPNDFRIAPATTALDRQMSREQQGELLGQLMDFRQHINAYVMAVNNVSMSTHGGDERIFRLFADVTKSEKERQADFESSMKALSSATRVFNETTNTMEMMRQETTTINQQAREEYEKAFEMKRAMDRHMETRDSEQRAMHDNRSRVKRLEHHLKVELQTLEQQKLEMERERQAYIKEASDKKHEAMKARLESAHMIAQSKGDAASEIESMKLYVMDQERLRLEAENRSREIQQKNSTMADRFKLLSDKLNQSRKEVKRLKGSKEGDIPSLIKVEDGSFASQRSSGSRFVMTPHHVSQFDDDGFVEMGTNRTTPLPIKRARFSSEKDDSAIVVLDDEEGDVGDSDYPMPGFLHQSGNVSTSSRRAIEADGDDSVEYVGEIRNTPERQFLASNEEYMQRATSGSLLSLGTRMRRR